MAIGRATTDGRVAGKVAIVTGAGRGQGRAHAHALAREGARVLALDVLEDDARETANAIENEGGDALALAADVGAPEDWQRAVAAALDAWGTIDVLVNNAGIIRDEDFVAETLEGWNQVIRVNQTGVFLGMKAVIPTMLERGAGSIINIASTQGVAALSGYAAYHASKAAVILMTRNAAVDYSSRGIRVNAICPGLVWTAMADGDGAVDDVIRDTPLGRGADPAEISPGVVFLASDEAAFVTGEALVMDGGYLAR
jgi:NAD(P)-dependent dehydrogenase (short-subunit alcohol dehydrogenase family)